jgi:hypothetical protein
MNFHELSFTTASLWEVELMETKSFLFLRLLPQRDGFPLGSGINGNPSQP